MLEMLGVPSAGFLEWSLTKVVAVVEELGG
jgi:hypothetical protein